jgi:hypothetical protein
VINVPVSARSALFPVDGGTGGVSGCWRPLFLPDTFYDRDGRIHYAGDPKDVPLSRMPVQQDGDYYRSRFAVSARYVEPYIGGQSRADLPVTGLRDTESQMEWPLVNRLDPSPIRPNSTLMGFEVYFTRERYFIANLTTLPKTIFDPTFLDEEMARFGYCGQIRVGDRIQVYKRSDLTKFQDVQRGLQNLVELSGSVDENNRDRYRYLTSPDYPDPNSHAAIIPVLLFNPFLAEDEPGDLRVTNIGLFFLQEVRADGTLRGFFVREIITGGTPIAMSNFSELTGDAFIPRWLPMSVRLQQ